MKKFILIISLITVTSVKGQDASISFKKNLTRTTNNYISYVNAISSIIEFSGSIKVYSKGKEVFTFNRGVESKKTNKPISGESKFAIASLTKSFTALKILQLVEEDLINLNKTISDYLPYYPKHIGNRISIANLLNNRSGLPDYTAKHFEIKQKNFDLKRFILDYCAEEPLFNPGERYQYSNTGFYILGAIIESITGRSYKEVIESDILKKSEMLNSGVFKRSKLFSESIVDGHEKMKKAEVFTPTILYAAGGIYSTTNDMIKWYEHLSNYKLLSASSVNDLFSGKPMQYYKGWGYIPVLGNLGFGHTGGVSGFNSQMLAVPSKDIFVIILCNNSPLPLRKMSADLASIAMGSKVELPEKRKEMNVPLILLKKFIGTYENEKGGNQIQIGVEAGKLYMQIGNSKRILKAETFDRYYFDQFGPTLRFNFKGGQAFTWVENGNNYNYKLISSKISTQKKSIVLPKSDIKDLKGTYLSKGDSIRIIWNNDNLMLRYKGKTKALIQKKGWSFYFEESENGYYFKYPVDFRKSNGKIELIYDGNIPFTKAI